MDIGEYTGIIRKGDMIFLIGGLIFVGGLLGLTQTLWFLPVLPAGIVIMGFGAQMQYAANERLKLDMLTELRIYNAEKREEKEGQMAGERPLQEEIS